MYVVYHTPCGICRYHAGRKFSKISKRATGSSPRVRITPHPLRTCLMISITPPRYHWGEPMTWQTRTSTAQQQQPQRQQQHVPQHHTPRGDQQRGRATWRGYRELCASAAHRCRQTKSAASTINVFFAPSCSKPHQSVRASHPRLPGVRQLNSFATAAITPLRFTTPVISYSEPPKKYHRGCDTQPYTRALRSTYVPHKTQPLHYVLYVLYVLFAFLLLWR